MKKQIQNFIVNTSLRIGITVNYLFAHIILIPSALLLKMENKVKEKIIGAMNFFANPVTKFLKAEMFFPSFSIRLREEVKTCTFA